MRIKENRAIGAYKEQFIRLIVEGDEREKVLMFKRLQEAMEKKRWGIMQSRR